MRNVSFYQFLILLFVCFLLFGDFFSIKKKLISFYNYSIKQKKNLPKKFEKQISIKNRKKRV
jgi:hypothetical protein